MMPKMGLDLVGYDFVMALMPEKYFFCELFNLPGKYIKIIFNFPKVLNIVNLPKEYTEIAGKCGITPNKIQ
jgi:hypothetical protein